jgi:hypothetical protein
MARVYIETTIASFYHEERTEPEMTLVAIGRGAGSMQPASVPTNW